MSLAASDTGKQLAAGGAAKKQKLVPASEFLEACVANTRGGESPGFGRPSRTTEAFRAAADPVGATKHKFNVTGLLFQVA